MIFIEFDVVSRGNIVTILYKGMGSKKKLVYN